MGCTQESCWLQGLRTLPCPISSVYRSHQGTERLSNWLEVTQPNWLKSLWPARLCLASAACQDTLFCGHTCLVSQFFSLFCPRPFALNLSSAWELLSSLLKIQVSAHMSIQRRGCPWPPCLPQLCKALSCTFFYLSSVWSHLIYVLHENVNHIRTDCPLSHCFFLLTPSTYHIVAVQYYFRFNELNSWRWDSHRDNIQL